MNTVIMTGRLTRDPERTDDRVRFGIATNEKEACFINCTAFGKTADFVEKYFTKGKPIGITGRLNSYTYQHGDESRTTFSVAVNTVEFLGDKAKEEEKPKQTDNSFDDEMPF